MKRFDIVVIGAGIAGLTAAIYLKRANANFILLEGKEVGGKLNDLKEIENYPGFSKTTGKTIKEELEKQIRDLSIEVVKTNVQTILKDKEGFEVLSDLETYKAKAVIVGTGIYEKGNPIKGEKEFFGQGVSYCAVCDGNFFKGMDVAVIGNNNTALEEALYLSGLVKKLYLVVPDSSLKGEESLLSSISKSEIVEVILNAKPVEIQGDFMGVSKLCLEDRELDVQGVFPYIGSKSSSQMLSNLKPTSNGAFIKTNESMETDIEGLFAIGDLRDKKLRQLVTASSDGAIAATRASQFVKQK